MKVLVVGGTGFLGSAIAHAMVSDGAEVTVLSRRKAADVQGSGIEILTADRHADLSILSGRRFDAVFDTCGYAPDATERLLDALTPGPGRYVFISSLSVYGDYSRAGLTEDAIVSSATPAHLEFAARVPAQDRASAFAYGDAYGPLKRSCECAALSRLGERALVLRSGLLVGAGDYTDRLTWWVRRIDAGGPVPVPGPPDRPVQLIDVRDAAAFARFGVNKGLSGVYNLTSRPFPVQLLFETARRVADSDASCVWVDQDRVLAAGLAPWSEIPLWLPSSNRTVRHFFEIDVEKAHADGLSIRTLEATLADILEWDRSRRSETLKCGMSKEKEALLLAVAG